MIEEILPDLYRMEVPLPNSPLKALNSYLIKGQERNLLIDTGMNLEECRQTVLYNFKKLDIDMQTTDIYITHLHADHLGLTYALAEDNTKVYFNLIEVNYTSRKERWDEAYEYYIANGFPEDELKKSMQRHPGYQYGLKNRVNFQTLSDGDNINIGDYNFICVQTPGHSPGHMCLYEASKKILVCGDQLLFDITPNITWWPKVENSLKNYLKSLDKIYELNVELTLPGHRRILNNHRERIIELKKHHHDRTNEIICILQDGEKTAFDIAPHVTWDIDFKSWQEFPPTQKWFAFGETIAHLEYLEETGLVKRKINKNLITFTLG